MSGEPWYNPLVRWLLRSPLHGLMSRSTVLVTVAGRKSGRAYTVPTSYARDGDTLWIVTRRDKTWYRNVRGGAPVELQLGGRQVRGFAEVLEADLDQAAGICRRVWPGMTAEQARGLAPQSVIIQIGLNQPERVQA
jgi:deazaflavin-dependent oxidoreductase (nitroreductase family)